MKELQVDIENCFGIGKLKCQFDFKSSNIQMIYAPNGTMKTSFAKTMRLLAKNNNKDMPKDLLDPSKSPKYDLIVDDDLQLDSKDILVINSEDVFDGSQYVSSFLAKPELKRRYDTLHEELNIAKNNFLKELKDVSKSSDCEGELLQTYSPQRDKSIFDIALELKDKLVENPKHYTFKYNEVFDNKGKVKGFIDKNKQLLEDYVVNYNKLLSSSVFFKDSVNSFGTGQANSLFKSIEDNSFFDAGHKLLLSDGTTLIANAQELSELIKQELEKILKDETLKKSFDKVDAAIGSNDELRKFKKVLEYDNTLILKVSDYEGFKREVWCDYFSIKKESLEKLVDEYEKRKDELQSIIEESKADLNIWERIIETFNRRFYVPFIVQLGNSSDVILKSEFARLEFSYDITGKGQVEQSKEQLLQVLSRGEKRAFYILQFLFEIEARKSSDFTLLILDDIADSFDYKNKFAIIEYIYELQNMQMFKMIVLTHNYDFYRTVESRLNIRKSSFIASKDETNNIVLKDGSYLSNVFKCYVAKDLNNDVKSFISLIPFVRNLVEYTNNEKDTIELLTACLHKKENSKNILVEDVNNIFIETINALEDKVFAIDSSQNIFDTIIKTANEIILEENIDEINLENKLVLAIGSRLLAEEFMLSKLSNINYKKLKGNQTRVLFNKYIECYKNCPNISTLDKVNLMTPENIHLNSFMYEPLLDMPVYHLRDLYKEIIELS